MCPWITNTPLLDRVSGRQGEVKQKFAGMNPSGKMAMPSDIASVVLACFAGTSGFENGAAVLVDSGSQTQRVQFPMAIAAGELQPSNP